MGLYRVAREAGGPNPGGGGGGSILEDYPASDELLPDRAAVLADQASALATATQAAAASFAAELKLGTDLAADQLRSLEQIAQQMAVLVDSQIAGGDEDRLGESELFFVSQLDAMVQPLNSIQAQLDVIERLLNTGPASPLESNTCTVTPDNTVILGGGIDIFFAGAGSWFIDGGGGADVLVGNSAADEIHGALAPICCWARVAMI